METNQIIADLPDDQLPVDPLALSLDSLLLNGIQFGVFCRISGTDFISALADKLLKDLDAQDEQLRKLPDPQQSRKVIADLQAGFRQMIDLLTRLKSFRSMSLPEVRALVSQISPLRSQNMHRIDELRRFLDSPRQDGQPQAEPIARSAFFANLETIFEEAWKSPRPAKSALGI